MPLILKVPWLFSLQKVHLMHLLHSRTSHVRQTVLAEEIQLTVNENLLDRGFAAADAVAAVTNTIIEVLKNGDEVSLLGFGKFSVVDVAEREARNPQTGETMTVAAHKAPKFKFASNVKADIR